MKTQEHLAHGERQNNWQVFETKLHFEHRVADRVHSMRIERFLRGIAWKYRVGCRDVEIKYLIDKRVIKEDGTILTSLRVCRKETGEILWL